MNTIDLQNHPEMLAFRDQYIIAINEAIARGWEGSPQTLSLPGFKILEGDDQPDFMEQVRTQMKEALDRVNALRGPTEREKLAARCQALYSQHIEPIRAAAYALGYAIGVHGTIRRDIDLIAVPWTEEARSTTELVSAILEVIKPSGGYLPKNDWVSHKPHGRLAFGLYFPGFPYQPYIDLSVAAPATGAQSDKEIRKWWDATATENIERDSSKADMERQDALDARKEPA